MAVGGAQGADAAVTGGASGIGAATARLLAARGMRVALLDVRGDAARETAEEIGHGAFAVELDVTQAASVGRAFADMEQLSVLVNAAGLVVVDAFEAFSADDWRRAHEVNVLGTYRCMVAALPALRATPAPARVVNLGSAAGKRAAPLIAPYAASKAAVMSLTRSAASAWAPDILVNCVSPGLVDTPMWKTIDARLAAIGAPASARYAQRARGLPVGRAATPQEVAAAIAYLCSDGAGAITGAELDVDAGLSLT
jgi:NAD(P)-dependent dehydrogenase (short-subunit alcohol dehydrogenase family)